MHERVLRRAVAIAAIVVMLAVGSALADSVAGDSDTVSPGVQSVTDLGLVAPGAVLTTHVGFVLTCTGFTHVADGQTVTASFASANIGSPSGPPPDGSVSATGGTVGPVSGWVPTGSPCSAPAETFTAGTPSTVTIMAPTLPNAPGRHYQVDLLYGTSVAGGNAAVTRFAAATFTLTVASDQPPTLDLPSTMTVEGNTTGGAIVSYTATATDAEDSPPPVPTCSPVSGSFFPLGTTSVGCTVTDSGGNTATGSFDVAVVDTSPPVLGGLPETIALTTYDPSGIAASYVPPTATDIVDPAPTVACAPAPGALVRVGTTTVTCTATDASHNSSSASFDIVVTYVRLAAVFDAPIGPSDQLAINPGRTLPVKVTVLRDGIPVGTGAVDLVLAACGGASLRAPTELSYQGDRWFVGLDTAGLSGCVRGTVRLDGRAAGSFDMNAGTGSAAPAKRRP